jgi:hypothetical protein
MSALLWFGPVTQHDIIAHPINSEARDDPAGIMRECQAVANAHQLPVRFSCETTKGISKFVFYPTQP